MPWYKEWFDRDEYELVYQNRDEEEAEDLIALILRTVQPGPGTTILDVGCGRGRHAISLARHGYHVTGIDLSPRAIEKARQAAESEGLDITFRRGDMREPAGNASFDGVVNLFTAFGYFDDEADHLRAMRAMTTALKPGGWFVQDFLNASYVTGTLVAEDVRTEGELTVVQRRWISEGRINKKIIIHRCGTRTSHTFHESVRLLTLEDLEALFCEADLDLCETFGDYNGAPHTSDSPRLILYARKR